MRPGRILTSFTRQEVASLFSRARLKVKVPGFRILRAPKSQEYGRCLIVTPRYVGTAPERNLIRRRIKAIFLEHRLNEKTYDLIILVSPEARTVRFCALVRIICSALS